MLIDEHAQRFLDTLRFEELLWPEDARAFADAVITRVLAQTGSRTHVERHLRAVAPEASPQLLVELLLSPVMSRNFNTEAIIFSGMQRRLDAMAQHIEAAVAARAHQLHELRPRPALYTALLLIQAWNKRDDEEPPTQLEALLTLASRVSHLEAWELSLTRDALKAVDSTLRKRMILGEGRGPHWPLLELVPDAVEDAVESLHALRAHPANMDVLRGVFAQLGDAALEPLENALHKDPPKHVVEVLIELLVALDTEAAARRIADTAVRARKELRVAVAPHLPTLARDHLDTLLTTIRTALLGTRKRLRHAAADALAVLPVSPEVSALAVRALELWPRDLVLVPRLSFLTSPVEPLETPPGLNSLRAFTKTHAPRTELVAALLEHRLQIRGALNAEIAPQEDWVRAFLEALEGTPSLVHEYGELAAFSPQHRSHIAWAVIPHLAPMTHDIEDHLEQSVEHLGAEAVAAWRWVLMDSIDRLPAVFPILDAVLAHDPELSRDPRILDRCVAGIFDRHERETALERLAAIGPDVLPRLEPLLASSTAQRRERVALTLAELAFSDALPMLSAALVRETSKVVLAALHTAYNVCHPLIAAHEQDTPLSLDWAQELDKRMATRVEESPDIEDLDPGHLPTLHWTCGAALSPQALCWLVHQLPLARPNPSLDRLLAFLQRDDLEALGHALLGTSNPTPGTLDDGQLRLAGRLGDEALVTELGRGLEAEARSGSFAVAAKRMAALAMSPTDAAVRWLDYYARKATSRALRRRAIEARAKLAERRGEHPDAMIEGVLPDLGFQRGRRPVPGTGLTLEISAQGLRVVDEDGAVRDAPQSLGKLIGAVEALVQSQLKRLELAMITGRSWTRERCVALFLNHPVISALCSGLVVRTSAGLCVINDKRELIDAQDTPVDLEAVGAVSLPHPRVMGPSELASMRAVLERGGWTPPFLQLERPVVASYEEGRKLLASLKALPTAHVAERLEALGYHPELPREAGIVCEGTRHFDGVWAARITHSGYWMGKPGKARRAVTVEDVEFFSRGEKISPQEVPPAMLSEAFFDAMRLTP